MDIAGLDDHDVLVVQGNFQMFDSCRLVVRRTSDYQEPITGDTFTLVQWSGSRYNQFASVTDANDEVTYSVTYDAQSLRLTVQ